MRFTKMQGIGNDYIYIDCFSQRVDNPEQLSVAMSAPHFGVGSDGLILVLPSDRADVRMRMFNRDGSEGAMCGNGARCVARFAYEHALVSKTAFTLEAGGNLYPVSLTLEQGRVASICVDMGAPGLLKVEPAWTRVTVGNDHVVRFVADDPFAIPDADFERQAAPLCHEMDANIEFVRPLAENQLQMRVYERGSGETLACGSGACAALVAAQTAGLCGREATVVLRGGALHIHWRASDGHVLMTGPAETVFEGEWGEA
ncbi:diaminopimelate epimerase [Clostridia bacterium]|nr:diaminopimelate epimerase [Clostridia bacterium]